MDRKLAVTICAIFLGSLGAVGCLVAGPYLMVGLFAIALPPAVLCGALAAFDRTRRIAVWVFRAFVFLVGWLGGLVIAQPASEGDKAFAMDIIRVLWLFALVAVLVPFTVVGLFLVLRPSTRACGKQVVLSLTLLPLGAALSWWIAPWAIPEWRASGADAAIGGRRGVP